MTETGTAEPLNRSIPPRIPTSTYRVQLSPTNDFEAVAGQVPYLASLGVSHLYLSPVLQAAPGSAHGYDVVDHARIAHELGGLDGLELLAGVAREHGIGMVVDVVPNHMAVPVPARHNRELWSVLRDGPASPFAEWFDIDWSTPGRSLLMPVLGDPIGNVLAAGDLTVEVGAGDDLDGGETVLRYHDHEFPVRPGTEHLPLEELLTQQWYRLAWWRIADEELNYRRFFDVDTLAALRVERPAVFEATHRLILDLVGDGTIDGLRIDHPDGLTDPQGYLERLSDRAPHAWIVVEKILAAGEALPASWGCHGTTGYEALASVGGLFIDGAGHRDLVAAYADRTGADLRFADVAHTAKSEVLNTVLAAEVERLVDLAADICAADIALHDHSRRALHESIVALLVAIPQYRIYVNAGQPEEERGQARLLVTTAAERAKTALPAHRHGTVELIAELALLERGQSPKHLELCTRLQQTSVSATAKGVEDTALYRWVPLAAANEVGSEPGDPAVSTEAFHSFAQDLHRTHPWTMTTSSTHDTKRGEDTRARLAVLSEIPERWSELVTGWHEATAGIRTERGPDRVDEELTWQTLIGLWPARDDLRTVDPDQPYQADLVELAELADRIEPYLVKALREAKRHTSWVEPDAEYERATVDFARAVLADTAIAEEIDRFVAGIAPAIRANVLGQKLIQLTMPGVPDVYQGAEVEWLAVVDPDNRRPLDRDRLVSALAHLDGGGRPRTLGEAKLLVTATALRLRRARPDWFDHRGAHEPVLSSTDHLVCFVRGGNVAVLASRLVAGTPDLSSATLALPPGRWRDLLTPGVEVESGGAPVNASGLIDDLPVALLVRRDAEVPA